MTTKKNDIRILRITHLKGPNIWTYRPVLEVWLDIGELEDHPSNTLPGLYERLCSWLPGLAAHRCGVGEEGGFLERLREGTWAGHILEHITLELQNLAGMRTGFGQTRSTDVRGIYKMAFRTRQEAIGRAALHTGLELLMAAINGTPFPLDERLEALRDMGDALLLGPSTASIVDAATDRGIPHIRLTDANLVQLGYGATQRRIWTAETDQTSAIAESIACDKDLTKTLLRACGVPVPEGSLVKSAEEAWEEAQDIGLPVVIKPYDGNHGRGVSLNLMTRADVEGAYAVAARKGGSQSVIVERFIPGDEHRVLVVGNRVVAVAKGESLWVTGDGLHTVQELVDSQINIDPRRGDTEEFPLNRVRPGECAEIVLELERQNLHAGSVPLDGQRVLIQVNGNVALDVTDTIHPDVVAATTLAARVVGLDIAGIDLVAQDIGRPLAEQGGAIIEVNASPGLLAHIKPANGNGRPVGRAIVDHLFAAQDRGRIPIVGVAGSRDAAALARLIGHLLTLSGTSTGVACDKGLFLEGRMVSGSDCTSFAAGQRLLMNRSLHAAVFQTHARAILAEGVPYDKCRIGIVTDMDGHEDLGEYYVREAEQMYKIMRCQIDIVLEDGAAVLNADDAAVAELAELCDGEVLLYSTQENSAQIAVHCQAGGRAVFLRAGHIVLCEGAQETALLSLETLRTEHTPSAATLLAGVAAAWALAISPPLIAAGLRAFSPEQPHLHY